MSRASQRLVKAWIELGPRFLPFADAASPELPLGRLLRLSLIQVSVGIALVLLVGTLNRVMIVELGVPASLVGTMLALPVLFAPLRAMIGFKSDTHRCELGWRRVPFIYKGTLLQFGGLALMPFALLVLAGGGESANAPAWIGQVSAAVSFLLVGIGVHTTQTVGLALATDLSRPEQRPNVVGLMYVMLLLGSIVSAMVFGWLLADFTHGRLIQVIQGAAVVCAVLNGIALWKQEGRSAAFKPQARETAIPDPTFIEAWRGFANDPGAMRRLIAIGCGTLAFGMQDVLLEPYGGAILGLDVSSTTKLTAALAFGGLAGFALASHILARGADAFVMASIGILIGIPGFAAVTASAPWALPSLFVAGVFLIGFGGGLFSHGTLTATMNSAPADKTGLALGAWGAVQATAAGVGIAVGGVMRDGVQATYGTPGAIDPIGYHAVYVSEIGLLILTLLVMAPMLRQSRPSASQTSAHDVLGTAK